MPKHNELHFRREIQKALQDNNLHKHEKICDLHWLLYRVRLGGNALRILARISSIVKAGDLTKEKLQELEDEFLTPLEEEYDWE